MAETYSRQEFFQDSPPPRLIGVEMEYQADTILDKANEPRLGDVYADMGLQPPGGVIRQFMLNGSRIYKDVGHYEYATPECLGPWQAAAADHAGAKIVTKITQRLTKDPDHYQPPLRRTGGVCVDMNDPGSPKRLVTRGYHENYLLPYSDSNQRVQLLRTALVSHLATRQIYNGNGMITTPYTLSQKASGIGQGLTIGYGNRVQEERKPMVGVLDGADKVRGGYSLAEVRYADSHLRPRSTFLALGSTSLVLRMIELGVISRHNVGEYSFRCPLMVMERTARIVGGKDTMTTTYETHDDKNESPLSLQRKLAEKAMQLCEDRNLPSDEHLAAEEWVKVVDKLSKLDSNYDDLSPVMDQVEWAVRYHYARQKFGDNLNYDNYSALAYDILWDSIGPDLRKGRTGALGERMIKHHDNGQLDFDKDINHLRHTPPATRAMARAALILDDRYLYVNSWSSLRKADIDPIMGSGIALLDPYDPNPPLEIMCSA